jgi:imidazolonepropionase-like amidohydrolase
VLSKRIVLRMWPFIKTLAIAILMTIFGVHASYGSDVVLVGAKIYPSPTEPPIEQGSILIHDGRIAEVGPTASVKAPHNATILDCTGFVITAGFWNSHVHILTPGLIHADKLSPDETTAQLQSMLTKWGFTTVFDIASVLKNTNLIRQRIALGESKGPRILTVGEPFWIATPIYVKSFLEANHVDIPSVHSPTVAKERVRQEIRDGADGIKIFANSIEQGEILTMPEDLAKSIVEEAHANGKPVFAHVSNNAGIEIALQSGVDILAHTTPIDSAWSPAFAKRLVAAHMALTPTLTLWEFESRKGSISAADLEQGMERAAQQLNAFQRADGDVLFGTDVGYTDVFDTSEEFKWMSQGGMNYQQILASLTTTPARRFGFIQHSGQIAKGYDADLVVLGSDPAHDATGFADVQYTIRGGRVIYDKKH